MRCSHIEARHRKSRARRDRLAFSHCARLLTFAGLCAVWCPRVSAVTRSWLDPVGGFFSDASNWSGSTVPGASDIAAFDLGSNYTVAFVTNPSNDRLLIEDDSVTLNLTGHTYSLTSTGSASLVVGIGARFINVL